MKMENEKKNGKIFRKTTINLPIELYKNIEKEAEELGINFTSMIIIKLKQVKKRR